MGPLPWVGVWSVTLAVLLMLITLVYFIPSVTDPSSVSAKTKLPYSWGW